MQIAARTAAWAKSGPTARDYKQASLAAMWDCRENIDWGKFDATSKAWVDLAGGNVIDFEEKLDFSNEEYCIVGGTKLTYWTGGNLKSAISGGKFTIEDVVGYLPGVSRSRNGTSIYGSPSGGSGVNHTYVVLNNNSTTALFKAFDAPNAYITLSKSVDVGLVTLSLVVDIDNGVAHCYVNGESVKDLEITSSYLCAYYYWGYCYRQACRRVYSRPLSAQEILDNFRIDEKRFEIA